MRLAASRPLVLAALLLATPSVTPPAAAQGIDARVSLTIELLLVDGDGIRLLRSEEVDLGRGGAHHQTLKLGRDGKSSLVLRLAYQPAAPSTIQLDLERSIVGDDGARDLGSESRTISAFDAWSTTLLEDSGLGGRLELRVVPFVRESIDDQPLQEQSLRMYFDKGPLIAFGERVEDDRLVFREINVAGTDGLRLGIPQTGIVKLSHRPFAGSRPCGWVRDHRLAFRVGEREYGVWSAAEILPADRSRPGKGWTLYCELLSDASLESGWWGPLLGEQARSERSEIVEARAIDLNWAMELNRNGRWDEAAALAERLLSKRESMTPLQACEARYHAIYGHRRAGRTTTARAMLADFDRHCGDAVAQHWLAREIEKLRGEL
jgi:hypothetical protein